MLYWCASSVPPGSLVRASHPPPSTWPSLSRCRCCVRLDGTRAVQRSGKARWPGLLDPICIPSVIPTLALLPGETCNWFLRCWVWILNSMVLFKWYRMLHRPYCGFPATPVFISKYICIWKVVKTLVVLFISTVFNYSHVCQLINTWINFYALQSVQFSASDSDQVGHGVRGGASAYLRRLSWGLLPDRWHHMAVGVGRATHTTTQNSYTYHSTIREREQQWTCFRWKGWQDSKGGR